MNDTTQPWQEADGFLVEAAGLLASSLEYEKTLAALAWLAVRSLAEYCVIDVLEDGGGIRRLLATAADADRIGRTADLQEIPVGRAVPRITLQVLETGAPALISDVTDEVLEAVAPDEKQRSALQALGPRSLMAVPLLAHDRPFGAVLFISATRRYDARDVAVAAKLARLAGLEVDNASHYRQAQRALDARDRVLGVVAHDLRNPLNTIIMTASLLHDVPLPDEEKRVRIEAILLTAHRMNRLIQDLLDVARLEGGILQLHREELEPEQLASEAVELSASRAESKTLRLGSFPQRGLPRIYIDRDRLLRVLTNLIDNAIKFTPDGGTIEVRVDEVADGVRFSVTDTGPGIAPEDLPHLFRPFWQARPTGTGAGLGLAIARGIVEAHGGTISVESAPGVGSTFHFTVPIEAAGRP